MMKRIAKDLICVSYWGIVGFCLLLLLVPGWLMAGNLIKGGSYNPDGEILVPWGYFLITIGSLLFISSLVATLLLFKNKKLRAVLDMAIGIAMAAAVYFILC